MPRAHDTLFTHPDDQLTDALPAFRYTRRERRPQWRPVLAACAIVALAAGTAAWVAVCGAVIYAAWG